MKEEKKWLVEAQIFLKNKGIINTEKRIIYETDNLDRAWEICEKCVGLQYRGFLKVIPRGFLR